MREVGERAGAQAEEAAVDPVLGAGLLAKAEHAAVLPIQLGHAELQLGAHDGDRGERAVRLVEAQQPREVDVGEAVGVGETERGLVRQTPLQPLDPPARGGVEAGVHTLHLHPLRPAPRGDEALDQLAAVARGQQEAAKALGGVQLDHVLHDRAPADLDQRLGDLPGALAQAGAAPAAEDHDGWQAGVVIGDRPRARWPTGVGRALPRHDRWSADPSATRASMSAGRRSWRAPRRRRRSLRGRRSASSA